MYLVERTFTIREDELDAVAGILPIIEKNRHGALKLHGIDEPVIGAQTRIRVTNEMVEAKDIVFRSTHEYVIDGVFHLRSVILFRDEADYHIHRQETIGIPPHIAETDLEMSYDGLGVTVVCEEIKRK